MSVARAFIAGQATGRELADEVRVLLYRLNIKLRRPPLCAEPDCPVCRPIVSDPDDPRSAR